MKSSEIRIDKIKLSLLHKIYFIFILCRNIYVIIFLQNDIKAYNLLIIDYFSVFFLIGYTFFWLSRPQKSISFFIYVYSMNIGFWLSLALPISSGRLMAIDLFVAILLLILLLNVIYNNYVKSFYCSKLFLVIIIYWSINFSLGALKDFGSALGEARFYFFSLVALLIIYSFKRENEVKNILKLISIASINIALTVIIMAFFSSNESTENRFNPGNGIADIILYGFIITITDYFYNTKLHYFNINKLLLSFIYLGVIFLTGNRTILVAAIFSLFYFFLVDLNPNLFRKKNNFILGILIGFVIVALSPAGKRVLDTQKKYLEISQGEGKKNETNTADFRIKMWEIMIDHRLNEFDKFLLGRPFENEQIDISDLNWNDGGKIVKQVDNSLAHNDFLSILMSNGAVFLLCLITILILYLAKSFVILRKNKELRPTLTVLSLLLICQLINSFLNAQIKHYSYSIRIWIFLGLLGFLFKLISHESSERKNFGRN